MYGVESKKNQPDPRITSALDELEMKYEIDDDGDFKVGFELDNGRTQLGFIRSRTFTFGDFEMREIFSAGLRSFGPFDARSCNLMLRQNSQVKVGAWYTICDAEDNHVALFGAKVSADLAGEALFGILLAIFKTADEMEERLSGRDDM